MFWLLAAEFLALPARDSGNRAIHDSVPLNCLFLVNLFLTNLVRISGFSSLFSAIAVFLALSGKTC